MDTSQTITSITTITAIMPTAAPALNMPPITEQLLKQSSNKMMEGKYNFFMAIWFFFNLLYIITGMPN
jgi:hypothetical protein